MNWYKQADKIKGGFADDCDESIFNSEQIQKGIKVEMEHTDDIEVAKEIAMDHLCENSKYYDDLEKIEPQHKED